MQADTLRRILGDKSQRPQSGERRSTQAKGGSKPKGAKGYAPLRLVGAQPPNDLSDPTSLPVRAQHGGHCVTPGSKGAEVDVVQRPAPNGQRVDWSTPVQRSPAADAVDLLSPIFSLMKVSGATARDVTPRLLPSPVLLSLESPAVGSSSCGSEVPETPGALPCASVSGNDSSRERSTPNVTASQPQDTHSEASSEDARVECTQRQQQQMSGEGSELATGSEGEGGGGAGAACEREVSSSWAVLPHEQCGASEENEWDALCLRLQNWTQMELAYQDRCSGEEQSEEGASWGRELSFDGGNEGLAEEHEHRSEAGSGVSHMLISPSVPSGAAEENCTSECGTEAVRTLHHSFPGWEGEMGYDPSEGLTKSRPPLLRACHQEQPRALDTDAREAVGTTAPADVSRLACRHFKRQLDAFEYADRHNERLRVARQNCGGAEPPTLDGTQQQQSSEDCHTASLPGALQVFCEEVPSVNGYSRKFVAGCVEAVWQYCCSKPPQERHLYEVIRELQPCKLYCDLEFAMNCNLERDGHAMVARLVARLAEEVREVWGLAVQPDRDVIELDSSTPQKFSRHLVVDLPGAAVRSNAVVGDVLSRCAALPEFQVRKDAGSDDLVPFVDMAVYSRNRHFRTYLSSKSNKHARLLPTDRFASRTTTDPKALFQASLICHLGSRRSVLEGPAPAGSRAEGARRRCDEQPNPFLRIDCQRGASNTDPSPSPELQQRLRGISAFVERAATIRSGGAPARVCSIAVCGDGRTLAFGLAGPGSHFCENVNRMHKSNHAFFIVDCEQGVYAQKCYDPECRHFRSAWLPLPASRDTAHVPTPRNTTASTMEAANQESVSDDARLAAFDRDPTFGPKAGISRHLRARRALELRLGLNEDTARLIFSTPDLHYEVL